MDRIARLEAIAAISSLKAKYFRCMDCKLWDELPEVFTDGMKVVTPDGAIYSEGGPIYAASLRHSLETSVSCHQGFTSEIEIVDEANARGIWAMQDQIWWPEGAPVRRLVGSGHYHETYVRLASGWRIATMQLTRLHREFEP